MGTRRSGFPPLLTLMLAAAAARILVLWVWPASAYSVDLKDWQSAAASLLYGLNPYVQSNVFNWPPMWLEVLWILGHLCDRFDWQLINSVRIVLIAADALMIASVWRLLETLKSRDRAFGLVLWGLCLNPFLILLTIQQGNFDVIPTIFVLWFLIALIRFRRGNDPIDWLVASAWLGLGGFAKTFPLVLAPLLFGESRRLSFKTRLLGAALCIGPAVLSTAPLFVLAPNQIFREVLFYGGTQGNVGASGLLMLHGGIPAVTRYHPFFTGIVVAALLLITLRLWFRRLQNDGDLVLLAALIFIGLFEFGTGYCPQYWMWPAPLLCIAYVQRGRAFKIVLLASAIVVVASHLLIFAYDRDLGSFALALWPNHFNESLADYFSDVEHDLIRFSLPMTVMTFLLWLTGVKSLASGERPNP